MRSSVILISIGVILVASCNASKSSSFVAEYPGLGYNGPISNLGQKRRHINLEGARSLIGHSLRVRKAYGLDNNFGHALRIRSGRQFDNFGHTLRIERTPGNPNSWKTRGYALRVRRDDEEPVEYHGLGLENIKDSQDMAEQVIPHFEDDHENQEESDEYENENPPQDFLIRQLISGPPMSMKKSSASNLDSMTNTFPKRKASLIHVLRVRKDGIRPFDITTE